METIKKIHPIVGLGIIIGSSFLIVGIIAAATVFRVRALNDTISVTGSAKMQVTSDESKWTGQITRTVYESDLKSGYAQLANDLASVKAYFASAGIADTDYTVSPIVMNEVYQQNDSAPKKYILTQTFEVQSNDVQKLTSASTNSVQLINRGVVFSTVALEYYYSKLPDARITLLSQAITDAKSRAAELAKNSGKTIGALRNASSGVVQVQSLNSTDVADYGTYDTSKIEKQITVTVKASFSLK